MQNSTRNSGPGQTPDATLNAAAGDVRRPRIGIPVRLSGSADPDPRVAKANSLFGCIVSLIRDVGGEPVLLTPESLERGLAGPPTSGTTGSAAPGSGTSNGGTRNSGTADDGTSDGETVPDAPEALDGVVLPGGGDVDPRLYGQEPGPSLYDVNAEQDRLDIAVARRALDAGTPVLGICRGHQLLNVLYGGTLVQDMTPGTVPHRQIPAAANRPWVWHEVTITPGSKVAKMYAAVQNPEAGETAPADAGEAAGDAGAPEPAGGVEVKIASGHHQAVDRVAPGLLVTAVADDGTVEALEDPDRWVASVQWHPEALELTEEQRLAPFRVFVEACRTP
ncbi:gamma-glutamyl-gamma-aminobutyrate hydrolase family protein [Arthrobacter globiformis]|uniref:gamma-glutamyl-gamma-aminobutyrate hydrolase family protein n=1 Tax=Arthrobacter globiformis TaxID=1665 RepID=UPI00277DE2E2|nr:gamma-glutamyl-gamma-aminobutyrate hydrolase family protein [Arthrobacter globiformis]MDQ0863590.1 putative glutamine amidotransferase [Arthrobacter globiformis]